MNNDEPGAGAGASGSAGSAGGGGSADGAGAGSGAGVGEGDAPVPLGKRLFKRLIAHPAGKLGGAVAGALVGIAVQSALQGTGVLGPGMEELISEQDAGFAALSEKIDALRSASGDAEVASITGEIEAMLGRQRELADRTQDELRGARAQIERLRAEALDARGSAGGAEVWLAPGESITVAGFPGNVFALKKFTYSGRSADLTVNVSGKESRMAVGDAAEFPAKDGVWRVIYKQATARGDGRVGFDLVFVPSEA